MTNINDNLEDRFLYRLIKVAYIFSLVVCVIAITFDLVNKVPELVISSQNSYVMCDGGKIYTLASMGVTTNYYAKGLSGYDSDKIKNWCYIKSLKAVTDPKILKELNSKSGKDLKTNFVPFDFVPLNKNYSLTLAYSRSWLSYIVICFYYLFYFSVFYVIASMIRETLVYLFFGRKFTWYWLRVFGVLLDKLMKR